MKVISFQRRALRPASIFPYISVHRFASTELAMTKFESVLVVDSGRRIQKPYETYSAPRKHGNDTIIKTQEWIENNFKEPIYARNHE